ncbi:MAG: dTDP-4-dehydrorhamnose 3,5-epimerase [Planctomycetota bacterium]|jgi:dTDP-4-dehydrorhamnose 3,5-epimerase|nr:dTDP-4-dehydrorhamnose 3,5-epimerase [Planctomycetota bacterium]
MEIVETELPGVLVIEPEVFGDSRGFFLETWNKQRYAALGVDGEFVQDNLSLSSRGVVRGLHYQMPHSQAKLVYVIQGDVFDVAVDIRVGSPTFGEWYGAVLSGENKRQVYVPEGFAHGFSVLTDTALFAYKCSDFYNREAESGIAWDDPDLGIDWKVAEPELSEKDQNLPRLKDVDESRLPVYRG